MEEIKYIVSVVVVKTDRIGNTTTESFEYEFNNTSLFVARKEAIEKAKNLVSFFEHEMPEDAQFSSFNEAEQKGFKDFTSYSLQINLIDENGESPIFGGDKEEQIDWLEYECQVFENEPYKTELIEIRNLSGDTVSVLKDDNDFLLSWYWDMKSQFLH